MHFFIVNRYESLKPYVILMKVCFFFFNLIKVFFSSFKVIPLFCTAHPLLRFFPLAGKEQTRATFAELKLSFAIENAADQLTASWSAIEKQENENKKCVKSAVVFHFAAVELWN